MTDFSSIIDLACIKESNMNIAKSLIDIKFLLERLLIVLERMDVKQDYEQKFT